MRIKAFFLFGLAFLMTLILSKYNSPGESLRQGTRIKRPIPKGGALLSMSSSNLPQTQQINISDKNRLVNQMTLQLQEMTNSPPVPMPAPPPLEINRDLGLDPQITDDLRFELSIQKREHDFLTEVVRVSPEKLRKIVEQKLKVKWQLERAQEYARLNGYRLEDVKKSILSKYVFWMQSTIGVGYYSKLQEMALSPE